MDRSEPVPGISGEIGQPLTCNKFRYSQILAVCNDPSGRFQVNEVAQALFVFLVRLVRLILTDSPTLHGPKLAQDVTLFQSANKC